VEGRERDEAGVRIATRPFDGRSMQQRGSGEVGFDELIEWLVIRKPATYRS
jgi:hypothetical protein